jgi:hypothetical protein
MKTTVIFALLSLSLLFNSKELLAQGETMYPIGEYYVPDVELSNVNGTIQGPSNVYLGGSHPSNYFKVNGSSNITVSGGKVVIRNSHIGGSTQSGFFFKAKVSDYSMGCNFSYQNGPPEVPLFEKIEFGLELPDFLQERIDEFLTSGISAANANHPGLNPYDPEDISVEATVFYAKTVTGIGTTILAPTIFGFYYQDFDYELNVSNEGIDWIPKPTKYRFRIRIAPQELGDHKLVLSVKYKDVNGNLQTFQPTASFIDMNNLNGSNPVNDGLLEVHFTGVNNDNSKKIHKGYLEVGLHKRHLRHSKSQTSFFPIGMNLPEVSWEVPYQSKSPRKYNDHRILLGKLAYHGGNFCRLISFNSHYTIEDAFNSPLNTNPNLLGNYQKPQKHMFELDKTIDYCENNNIFLLFCLQTNYPFFMGIAGYNPQENWENNPYNYELLSGQNPTLPDQFLTHLEAIRFWKNKARYAQARWGYSPAIAAWQLMNEINDMGLNKVPKLVNGVQEVVNGEPQFNSRNPYYLNSPDHRPSLVTAVANWHCTMASYLKTMYPAKIITPNYIERAGINGFNYEFDNTHACQAIDFMTYNTYNYSLGTGSGNRIRFQNINDLIYKPSNTSAIVGNELGIYSDKPLLLAEIGSNGAEEGYTKFDSRIETDCTDIEFHNAIWAGVMSGTAGTPLQWHRKDFYDGNFRTYDLDTMLRNFEALNSFFADLDFETHKYRPSVSKMDQLIHEEGNTEEKENEMQMEVYVMQNDNSGIGNHSDMGFGWVHHKKSGWKIKTGIYDGTTNSCADAPLEAVNPIDVIAPNTNTYKLEGFKTGSYFLEAYDTQTGAAIFSSNYNSVIHAGLNNKLELSVPHVALLQSPQLVGDYAFKFWHVSQNGNDLRLNNTNNTSDSTKLQQTEIILPGDNDEFKKYAFVSVAPNPFSSVVNVNAADEITNIILYDCTGRVALFLENVNNNSSQIQLQNFADGIYQLNVQTKSGITKTFKIVKNE